MAINRRRAREQALMALYAKEFNPESETVIHSVEALTAEEEVLANRLIQLFHMHEENIDNLIRTHLHKWSFEQLHIIDKSILRLAIAEYKYSEEPLDRNIVIDEAVEFAKIYGDDQSYRFINGLLDSVLEIRHE